MAKRSSRYTSEREVINQVIAAKGGSQSAKAWVIEYCARMCHGICRQWASDWHSTHDDLMQQAAIGVLQAIERYDHTRSTGGVSAFKALARGWIRTEVRRARTGKYERKPAGASHVRMATPFTAIKGNDEFYVAVEMDHDRILAQQVLSMMSQKQRYCVEQHIAGDRSLKSVAREFGCSHQWIHVLVKGGIKAARRGAEG